jgi:hypothetical protein
MATINDVKELLLRGLDPRNTVNRLNAMLADSKPPAPPAPEAEKIIETTKKFSRKKK